MKIKKNLPENAIPIMTYDKLDSFADEFAAGAYDFIGIIGNCGLGKSQAFSNRLSAGVYCLISGASTPFQVYQELYHHRDQPVIFDDADDLWLSPKARPMLKQLCETNMESTPRLVSYRSREIERLGLPTSFKTSSKVAIICNNWPKGLNTVSGRGIILYFCPNAYEVHERVRLEEWFDDEEVLEFLEQILSLITTPSMRYYIHAHRMREAGRNDWQDHILAMIQPNNKQCHAVAVVNSLMRNTSLSKKEKVHRFMEETGMSQATFYRILRDLASAQGLAEIAQEERNIEKSQFNPRKEK